MEATKVMSKLIEDYRRDLVIISNLLEDYVMGELNGRLPQPLGEIQFKLKDLVERMA